jgi:hypothetical protein
VVFMSILKNILSYKELPIVFSVILVFILGLQKNYGPDVGFHLQSAKWMLENGKIITQDVFTYTSLGNRYFDLQWLYQFVLYGLYKIGKDELLVIVNSALIAISVFIAWLRVKTESENKTRTTIFLLTVIIGTQALMFEVRPHVFSWLFLSLILFTLLKYKAGHIKKLYAVPAIMLVWANFHSLSVLGLVVIGIYTVGTYLENKKADKHLSLILLLSFLALAINPYFFEGFLFQLRQFSLISGDAGQKHYISELQTPFTFEYIKQQGLGYIVYPLFYLQLFSILAILTAIKFLLKKQITKALLIFSFFIILYLAIKNYGYFLIVALPFVSNYMNEWVEERKKKKKWNEEKLSNRFAIVTISLAIIISWLSVTDGLKILRQSPYRFGISVDNESVPVEATEFLNKNKIYGKIMNHLDFGGYLMYNYPEKVFIDGRLELIKPEFFNKYFSSLKKGEFETLLREYDPEIIILPYTKATGWWSNLINNKNFRAVYFDGLAAIYLKNGKFENIKELSAFSVKINSFEDINSVIKEDKPSKAVAVLKRFFRKQYFPINEQNRGAFCFTYGYYETALQYSALGIKKATVNPNNIFYNLSLWFNDNKNYNEAAICSKKAK